MEPTKEVALDKNAIAKNSTTRDIAVTAPSTGAFSSEDFVIPRIQLIQKMSKKAGKDAQYGELRDNLNNKLMGSMEKSMEFIPIHGDKKWIVSERDEKGRYQWKSTDVWEGPREFYSEDKKIKNMLSLEFYVLIPEEIEKGEDMPYIISFQSTSSKAGKKLATQMYMRNLRGGKPVYAAALNLSVNEETTDDNSYGVMDVSVSREVSKKEIAACENWVGVVTKNNTPAQEEVVPF